MPTDHSTVAQTLQVAAESTEGTNPASSSASKFHILPALNIDMNMESDIKSYRPSGFKYNTIAIEGKEWTTGKISGPLVFTDIVYMLASIMNYAQPNDPTAAGKFGAVTWLFQPNSTTVDVSKAYTIEWGDSSSVYKCSGNFVSELTIKMNRDEGSIDGAIMGRRMSIAASFDSLNLTNITSSTAVPGQASTVVTLTSGTNTSNNIFVNKLLYCSNADGSNGEWVFPTVASGAGSTFTAYFQLAKSGTWNITDNNGTISNIPASPAKFDFFYDATAGANIALKSPPASAPAVGDGGAGSLPAGVYTVAYSYVGTNGETYVSPVGTTASLAASHQVSTPNITPLPTGVTSVNWYMSIAAGSTTLGFVKNNAGTADNLNALGSGTVAPPVANTLELGNRLTRGFEASVSFKKRFNPFWPVDSTQGSFAGRVEDAPDVTLSLKVGADTTTGAADFVNQPFTLAALRAGSTVFFKMAAQGPQILSGTGMTNNMFTSHYFSIEMAVKLTKALKFEDVDGTLLGLAVEGTIVHDATWGKAIQATVVNQVIGLNDRSL